MFEIYKIDNGSYPLWRLGEVQDSNKHYENHPELYNIIYCIDVPGQTMKFLFRCNAQNFIDNKTKN